jgi:hypothetical protein
MRIKKRLRRPACNHGIRNRIRVALVRIADLAEAALQLHAAALLDDMRRFVRRCMKIGRPAERNVIPRRERMCIHRGRAFACRVVGVGLDMRDVMPAKQLLDRVKMRQLSTATSRAVRRRRLDVFGRWPPTRLPRPPLHGELLDPRVLADATPWDIEGSRCLPVAWPSERPAVLLSHRITSAMPRCTTVDSRERQVAEAHQRLTSATPAAALTDGERAELVELRPPDDLGIVTAQSLPPVVKEQLEEKDGRIGYIISIRPAPRLNEWNGHDLIRFGGAGAARLAPQAAGRRERIGRRVVPARARAYVRQNAYTRATGDGGPRSRG